MANFKKKIISKTEDQQNTPQHTVEGFPKKYFTRERIAKALMVTDGMIMKAAQKLGCHYNTIKEYVQKDVKLSELLSDIVEERLDIAESSLMILIRNGNYNAISFYLRCKGKGRGWIEDSSLGKIDKPIIFNYKHITSNTQVNNYQSKEIDAGKTEE